MLGTNAKNVVVQREIKQRKKKPKECVHKKGKSQHRNDPKIYIKFRNLESINFCLKLSHHTHTRIL